MDHTTFTAYTLHQRRIADIERSNELRRSQRAYGGPATRTTASVSLRGLFSRLARGLAPRPVCGTSPSPHPASPVC